MQSNSTGREIKQATLRRLDLSILLREACDPFLSTAQAQNVAIDIDVPTNLWVDLDAILIREAFRKLIDNALEAMPEGGALTITSLIGRFGLEVEFADSGKGIPEAMLGRVFEPFATNKSDHAGLGLSMVKDITTAHGGTISVQDCPDGGTAFTMLFPLRDVLRNAA